MARPALLISPALLRRLYDQERRSLREVEAMLRVSRWVLRERLRELGIVVRERDEASDIARWTRTIEAERAHERQCALPACYEPVGSMGLRACGKCRRVLARAEREGRCAWPSCEQPSKHGACYGHRKRLEGLIV